MALSSLNHDNEEAKFVFEFKFEVVDTSCGPFLRRSDWPIRLERKVSVVRIEEIQPEGGKPYYYVFCYESTMHEISETQHNSLEEAFEQANKDYGITADQWTSLCK